MVDVRPSFVMSPLTPERVTGAEFGNSFRGFDPAQVRGFLARIALEFGSLQERERDLAAQVAELERQLAEATSVGNQVLDEHRLTELLGVETARVLEAARDAASVLKANAEAYAAATVATAEADAVELRGQAESLLDERARAAEAEAARLLADAEAEAARIRDEAEALRQQARRDADEHRADARDEGRRMVAEARAVRERILTDMARRRNQARQQLERMRAGRERLLDAIEAVRRAVDGASGELNDAVVEAKLAGERAGRQVDVDAVPPMSELDAEVDLARDAGLIDTAAIEREVVGAVGLDEVVEVVEVEAEVAEPEDVLPIDDPVESTRAVQRFDVDSTPAERFDVDSTEAQRFDVDSVQTSANEVDAPADTGVDLLEDALPSSIDHDEPVDDADGDEADDDVDVEADASTTPPARRQGFSHAVDDLFSRWKQGDDQHEAASTSTNGIASNGISNGHVTAQADDHPAASDVATAGGADPATSEEVPADEDAAEAGNAARPSDEFVDSRAAVARQTRDAVLAGIARDLTRHLKLALSDEQNLVLEGQRDQRSRQPKRAVADLWSELEGSDRYEQATRRELIGALEAGWGAVRAGTDERPDPALLDPVVDELCRLLTGPLRERLHRALDDAGDDAGAAERVRNLYRETRTEQAGPLAEHGALAAFASGQHAAAGRLPAGPDLRVRWAFDGCVPDCYDNFLAGPLPLDATFPTDHRHPPAFPGCRCLLIVDTTPTGEGVDEEPPRGH